MAHCMRPPKIRDVFRLSRKTFLRGGKGVKAGISQSETGGDKKNKPI